MPPKPQLPNLLPTTIEMRHLDIQAAHRSCTSRLWTKSPIVSNGLQCIIRPHATANQVRHQQTQTPTRPQPSQDFAFWKCRHNWRRATVNTTRCLIGCSLGDLSAMYYLMTCHPAMNAVTSMGLSSKSNPNQRKTALDLSTSRY
jgi:hypothetical protein